MYTLSSKSSSPGIVARACVFYTSHQEAAGWSVGRLVSFFSRLALEHELYIEAQKKWKQYTS